MPVAVSCKTSAGFKTSAARKTSVGEEFSLGAVAAGVSKTMAAPIERVKLLLQNQDENVRRGVTRPGQRYKGIVDCFLRVPREQGFTSLWRGNLANVARYIPQMALNFAFKDYFKGVAKLPPDTPFAQRLCHNVAFGGAAGATSLLIVYPLDFARTRLALDTGTGGRREFSGIADCITKTAQRGGWGKGGVYNGFTVSCTAMTIARGLQFGLYDTLRELPVMENAGFWSKFGLGYGITVGVGMAVYPLDTVCRRMMMTSGEGQLVYRGALHCARKAMAEEGLGTFFKGAGSNVLRSLCGALVLVLFEDMKELYVNWKYEVQQDDDYVGRLPAEQEQ